jgi:hypothetical protein
MDLPSKGEISYNLPPFSFRMITWNVQTAGPKSLRMLNSAMSAGRGSGYLNQNLPLHNPTADPVFSGPYPDFDERCPLS